MADDRIGDRWGRDESATQKQLEFIEYKTGQPAPDGLTKRAASEIIEQLLRAEGMRSGMSEDDVLAIINRVLSEGGRSAPPPPQKKRGGCTRMMILLVALPGLLVSCMVFKAISDAEKYAEKDRAARESEARTGTPTHTPPDVPDAVEDTPAAPAPEPTAFDKIENGMDLVEVEKLLGKAGAPVSTREYDNGSVLVVYSWTDDAGTITVSLLDGRVAYKAQSARR